MSLRAELCLGPGPRPPTAIPVSAAAPPTLAPTATPPSFAQHHAEYKWLGARRTFFEHLQALTTYWHFATWERLMDFMMQGLEIGPHAAPTS